MGLFGRRREPALLPPYPIPVISGADLADAQRILDGWDVVLGDSAAMWDYLGIIGRRGGFQGGEAMVAEAMAGREMNEILQRPWRWWSEAAREANTRGQDVLAARIFLFTHTFVTQVVPQLTFTSETDTGLVRPADQLYQAIASRAGDSLARLHPSLLLRDTSLGRVDVATAAVAAGQVLEARDALWLRPEDPATRSPKNDD